MRLNVTQSIHGMEGVNKMPNPVITVFAYILDNKQVGKEEFPKGTNLDHVMAKMVQKYGQISCFQIHVPPVFEEINKRS